MAGAKVAKKVGIGSARAAKVARAARAVRTKAEDSECGCGACPGVEGTSSRRKAAGVDADIKAANLKHLARIEGQVRGIMRMIEDDRYCADIITQVSAVRESLSAVGRNLMRNHLKHCATRAMEHQGAERDAMVEELLGLVAKLGC